MQIRTPEELDQLRHLDIPITFDEINVEANAEPDMSTDPKILARLPYPIITLRDIFENYIKIETACLAIIAWYQTSDHSVLSLPDFYYKYSVNIPDQIFVLHDEINYMLQWKNARELKFFVSCDVVLRLQQPSKLNEMTKLISLTLGLDESAYLIVQATNFLNHLPALKTLTMDGIILGSERINEFVKRQGTIKGWHVQVEGNYIIFTRKQDRKIRKELINQI